MLIMSRLGKYFFLAAIYVVVLVSGEFQVKDDIVPTYLEAKFETVDEDIFPNQISMRLSLTKITGTLLCTIDANGNQLIMKLSSLRKQLLKVEFRGKETTISIDKLCGCTICAYTPLSLTVTITSNLQLQCNGQYPTIIKFDETIAQNTDFPTTKPQKRNNKNSAYLWLINTPQDGKADSNPKQLKGCIFSVEYKNRLVNLQTFGSINARCPQTCIPKACHGGVCYETYMDEPLCDCSYTFGSGPTCMDESRVINKGFDGSFLLSNIKLSWQSVEGNVFEMRNKLVTLKFNVNNNILQLDKQYNGRRTLDILTENYNRRKKYIVVMNFGSPTTVTVNNETKIELLTPINEGVFDYIAFSSGRGVIDMAFKTENSQLSWQPLSSIVKILPLSNDPGNRATTNVPYETTSKSDDRNDNLWALVVIFVVLFIVVFVPLWMKRKTHFRRISRSDSVANVPLNPINDVDVGKIETLHFETFSVVRCLEKFESIVSVISKLHTQLLPLKNPSIICQLSNPLGYLPSNVRLLQLIYDDFGNNEFLVCCKEDSDEQIKSRIKELRSCSTSVDVHDMHESDRIFLKMDKQSMERKWRNYNFLTIEGIGEPLETVHFLLKENIWIHKLKGTLINFLKTFYSEKIKHLMEKEELDECNLKGCLDRLMKLRMQLVSFDDKNKLSILDSITVNECRIANNNKVTMQKCLGKVLYMPPLFETMSFKDSVHHLMTKKILVVQSITDESLIVMTRIPDETLNVIRNKIFPLFPGSVEINFVNKQNGLIQQDVIDDDFLQCAVVLRYDDSSIKQLDLQGNELKESTENITAMYRIDKNIYFGKRVADITKDIIAMAAIGTHKRIMKYQWFYQESPHYYIFMDAMKESLKEHVKRNGQMSESSIIRIGRQILEGLAYLHEKNILYLNLKTSNVFLDEEDNIILSDFSGSKYVSACRSWLKPNSDQTYAISVKNYSAPEVLIENKYDFPADVWSFGMVIVEMVTGHVPFEKLDECSMIKVICEPTSAKYKCPANLSRTLKIFINSCLRHDPKQRKTCKELLTNNIFTKNEIII